MGVVEMTSCDVCCDGCTPVVQLCARSRLQEIPDAATSAENAIANHNTVIRPVRKPAVASWGMEPQRKINFGHLVACAAVALAVVVSLAHGASMASAATKPAATKPAKPAKPTTAGSTVSKTTKPAPTTTTEAAKDVKTDIERKIVAAQQSSAPDLKVGNATCPKALAVPTSKLPVGTFQCTVIVDGTVAPYEVILSNTGGFQKGGTYRIAPAKAIIDTAKIVAFVSASLDDADRASATIACGKKRVVVLDPGKTISCTIVRRPVAAAGASSTVNTTPQTLVFLVKDRDGKVALQTT